MDLTLIQKLAAYSLPIIFAITVHEAAHGYAAKYFGDMTAFHLNRISLNPLRHIDPLGRGGDPHAHRMARRPMP